jgi:putative membrane protein
MLTSALSVSWPPKSMWEAAIASGVFGLIGILLVILGFKLFDWLTPGKLQDEIVHKSNIAAAILAGAFIIGICIVIAAAVG